MSIRQQSSGAFLNTSSPVSLSFPSGCAAGNAILAVLCGHDGGGSVSATVADDKSGGSNTYNTDATTDAAARVMCFYAENIGVCQQLTLTPAANINGFWQIFEIDNLPASSILAAASGSYTDPDSSPNASVTSGTPSQATNIVFAAACSREDFGTFTLTDPAGTGGARCLEAESGRSRAGTGRTHGRHLHRSRPDCDEPGSAAGDWGHRRCESGRRAGDCQQPGRHGRIRHA